MSAEPLLLAVDSSTEWLGVALLEAEDAVETIREHHRGPGSERLLPLVDTLLERAGRSLDAVVGYAVAAGPGSFTGLRVGIATVKGLAHGAGPCVAPVSTLEALAAAAAPRDAEAIVVAALDARRGELYVSATRFRTGDAGEVVVPACVATPDDLAARLANTETPLLWVGDAPKAAAAFGGRAQVVPPPDGAPDPVWVGRLGARALASGRGVDAAAIAPWYLRRAEAEARRTGEAFEPPHNGV